jgi:propionate CoA-transferase
LLPFFISRPGGFIDISQSTKHICFMTPFTAKGLKVAPGNGELKIEEEGKVKKFVNSVYETTFSGDEAVRRGQKAFYVTERAVFRRSPEHDVLELIEIAPGIDLQKDVLDQMEFTPAISPDLRVMDPRIFFDAKMGAAHDFFGSLDDRIVYDKDTHTIYLDLFGIMLHSEDDIDWFEKCIRDIFQPYYDASGPINLVINYDGFDLGRGLENYYSEKIGSIQTEFYKTWVRYTGNAFQRAQLKEQMKMQDWNPEELFAEFSTSGNDTLTVEELRDGFEKHFRIQLTPSQIHMFQKGDLETITVDKEAFERGVQAVMNST